MIKTYEKERHDVLVRRWKRLTMVDMKRDRGS